MLIDDSSLTPMMRQWAHAKNTHPDCILLFRMGDFYELFGDDAKTAAKILDLTLTSRDKDKSDMKMAGFPFHAAENYIAKLVSLGHKVAICEQLEDPKSKKGIVKRGITEVVTPSTMVLAESSSFKENYLLGVIKTNNGFFMAFIDILSANFFYSSVKDEKSFLNEISKFSPKEILILKSQSQIFNTLKNSLNCRIEEIKDSNLTENKHYIIPKDCLKEETQSLSLVLFYLENMYGKLPNHIKAPRRYNLGEHLYIDQSTKENLHLKSLALLINRAITPMGKRYFEANVYAPLTNIFEIEKRQNEVEDFLNKPKLRSEILYAFNELVDLPRFLALISNKKITKKHLLALKNSILSINNLSCDLKTKYNIPDLKNIYDLLYMSISDADNKIFKKGFDENLDELYDLSEGGENTLLMIESRERQRTGISSLKVRYTRVFGYYIEVTKSNLDKVPEGYKRKQTVVNAERFVTDELFELEVKLNSAKESILELEQKLYTELLDRLYEYSDIIMEVSKIISHIDFINALSEVACIGQYVKPKIEAKESCILEIEKGRHPVAENLLHKNGQYFVPNDFFLNSIDRSLVLITGPNMAGKSTIMRQVALIQIMAQIGSFVPCARSRLSIVDSIFARVGASDDLLEGRSTFMVEMNETAQILSSATQYSLIILDEIGRGTSTYDGMAIAQSVCEYVHDHLKSRTIFATHYHELTFLEKTLFKLKNMHVTVGQIEDQIQFFYKLKEGPAEKSFGIEVARLSGLPEIVIKRARQVLNILEKEPKSKKIKILKEKQQNLFGSTNEQYFL